MKKRTGRTVKLMIVMTMMSVMMMLLTMIGSLRVEPRASASTMMQMSGCSTGSFSQAPNSPFGAGDDPRSVATGDFNLDGKPDLAVANFASNNVTIRLGDGVGGFPTASTVSAGTGAQSIAVGDFNLDGKPDLAVANTNSGSADVTIRLGDGTGGFPTSSTVGAGTGPISVAIGDFNLDGKPDLAVANVDSGNVTIRLGNGTGGFPDATSSTVDTGNSPRSVAVGDFNLDGKPDLATANGTSDNVTIRLGDGMGGFPDATSSTVGAGTGPFSVAIGDFNLDGKPDLAVANAFSDNVTIRLGDGMGGFPTSSTVGAGDQPFSVAIGDFNLDGKPDLAVANLGTDNVTIRLGDGMGGFPDATSSTVGVGAGPFSVAVGDFNLDGKPDFATTNRTSDNVTVQLNTCDALPCTDTNFTQPTGSPFGAGNSPRSVAVGDFNLDGKPDLAVANSNSDNVTIRLGDGMGGFPDATSSTVGAGDGSFSVATADFNLDGKPDLAVANGNSNNVTIRLGDGMGGFPTTSTVGAGSDPTSVVTGDFNLDGKPDLAVANAISDNVTVRLGDGTGGFPDATSSTVGAGDQPDSVATGDFNLDGKPDLAVANFDSNNVMILIGNGTGGFPTSSTVGAGTAPVSVAIGDFNLDGKPDLAIDNVNSFDVTILLGNGMGGFAEAANSPFGAGILPRSVAIGDFNLDGKPDLAVANLLSNNVTILLGDGTGGFPTSSTVGVGDQPFSVAVGDFNLDGKPDFATANRASANVTVQLNTCTSNQPPVAMCQNVTVNADNNCTAEASIDNGSSDPDGDMITLEQSPAGPYPKGTTSVTLTVTDSRGAEATCTATVTVIDAQAPTIACSSVAAQSANASGSCSANVPDVRELVRAQSSDNCASSANLTITQSPVQGSSVSGIGSHPITVTVTDQDNNSATCTVAFTVNDITAPSITCSANLSVPAPTGQCEATVSYNTPSVNDNCSGAGSPVCSPASGSTFPRGTTTVTCQVSDASGNTNQCSFTVTVNDTQAPTIACPSSIITNTINAGDGSRAVSYTTPVAADNCSGASAVCVPPSGSQFPRGTTTVTCTASDTSNNQTACSFTVKVFDQVIVDNVNGKLLRFISTTGEYDFFDCKKGTSLSGKGAVTVTGCKVELRHTGPDAKKPDRNVFASTNICTKAGSATVVYAGTTHTLNDSNLSNNPLHCP